MPKNREVNFEDFQSFKLLSAEEREFFLYTRLSKIDDIYEQLDAGSKHFAAKWVEHAMKGGIVIVLSAVLVAVLATIGLKGERKAIADSPATTQTK